MVVCPSVLLLLATVSYVGLQFMASDFQYGILKLFMEKETAYDE
jgi:hypothetical protein